MSAIDMAKIVTAWMIPIFIGLLGLLVLYKIYTDGNVKHYIRAVRAKP